MPIRMGEPYRGSSDIGGRFTDIVFQDSETGECGVVKVLSTPKNPALSVLEGIRSAIPADATIDVFVHGGTVGLIALMTRRGAKVALLTTHNFRDIYTIQGNDRGAIVSIRGNKPKPRPHRRDRRGGRPAERERSGRRRLFRGPPARCGHCPVAQAIARVAGV